MYKFSTTIKSITNERRLVRASKDPSDPTGKSAIESHEDLGWFVGFADSWIKFCIGASKPTDLKEGQKIIITISPDASEPA